MQNNNMTYKKKNKYNVTSFCRVVLTTSLLSYIEIPADSDKEFIIQSCQDKEFLPSQGTMYIVINIRNDVILQKQKKLSSISSYLSTKPQVYHETN